MFMLLLLLVTNRKTRNSSMGAPSVKSIVAVFGDKAKADRIHGWCFCPGRDFPVIWTTNTTKFELWYRTEPGTYNDRHQKQNSRAPQRSCLVRMTAHSNDAKWITCSSCDSTAFDFLQPIAWTHRTSGAESGISQFSLCEKIEAVPQNWLG